ncbi:MAG: hypothetical protein EOO11_18670 [Chitinophagaceae bacterium]|nr:MAG: hypothetical protein EOO11_18670 [Chitinophagaceae bacterium]
MRNTLILLLLAASSPAAAQSLLEPLATRYQRLSALASTFVTADAQEANPASAASLTNSAFSVAGERRFFLKELSVYRAHAAFPVAAGVAGAGLVYGGHDGWRELALRGTYARRLGAHAAIGVSAQWLQAGNSTYGTSGALLADAGLRWELASGVSAGIRVHNPARVRLGKSGGERLPAAYGLGVTWEHDKQWLLGAELEHRDGHAPAVLAGAEYVFAPALRARCGIDSGAPAAWLGLGTVAASMQLNITVTLHRELGATPVLQLVYPAQ